MKRSYPGFSNSYSALPRVATEPAPTRKELKAAYEAGQSAFKRGLKSAPVLDAEFKKIEGWHRIEMLTAHSKGWHDANLATPVEGDF